MSPCDEKTDEVPLGNLHKCEHGKGRTQSEQVSTSDQCFHKQYIEISEKQVWKTSFRIFISNPMWQKIERNHTNKQKQTKTNNKHRQESKTNKKQQNINKQNRQKLHT